MRDDRVGEAIREARRFIDRAERLMETGERGYGGRFYGSKESGAVRRASMDLTRALAEMRKYD